MASKGGVLQQHKWKRITINSNTLSLSSRFYFLLHRKGYSINLCISYFCIFKIFEEIVDNQRNKLQIECVVLWRFFKPTQNYFVRRVWKREYYFSIIDKFSNIMNIHAMLQVYAPLQYLLKNLWKYLSLQVSVLKRYFFW